MLAQIFDGSATCKASGHFTLQIIGAIDVAVQLLQRQVGGHARGKVRDKNDARKHPYYRHDARQQRARHRTRLGRECRCGPPTGFEYAREIDALRQHARRMASFPELH